MLEAEACQQRSKLVCGYSVMTRSQRLDGKLQAVQESHFAEGD
jgi:hypothetical protein